MLFKFLTLLIFVLIALAMYILLKIKRFARKNETEFFGIYIKKRPDKKIQIKIKSDIVKAFANSSHRNKILCWSELSIYYFCYYGCIILFLLIRFFDLKRIWLAICLGVLIAILPIGLLLRVQLYSFWKSQPIWKEQSVEKQPFLLPNSKDYKLLMKYWFQVLFITYSFSFLGFYIIFHF